MAVRCLRCPSPKGICPFPYGFSSSDAPDGPIVEKGGVAEVIRKGNNPPATNTTPTWVVNRTVYTFGLNGTTLTPFTAFPSDFRGELSLANFILGHDVNDENDNGNITEARPSLHGDEVHSRPQPVDYGGTTGVTVYYGSNDGMLRAVTTPPARSGGRSWRRSSTPGSCAPPSTPPVSRA